MRLGMFDLRFKIAADFEQLLRLIFVNNIKTRYIPKTFVTMRTGGASTSGLSSHKQIYHDHMMAYKVNGVYSTACSSRCDICVKSASASETKSRSDRYIRGEIHKDKSLTRNKSF